LEVRGNIRLGFSGELHATAGEENLRIIRGEIAGNGAVVKGSGFTASHGPITGTYTINFTTPFADRPSVTATAFADVTSAVMLIGSASGTSVQLQARNMDAFALVQARFHFIAVGPR
jgi:hypothetical protein